MVIEVEIPETFMGSIYSKGLFGNVTEREVKEILGQYMSEKFLSLNDPNVSSGMDSDLETWLEESENN